MCHYFIDKLRSACGCGSLPRLEKAGKALDKLESSGGRTLKGERFVTDELSRLLKISRRTLQEYRTARIIPYYLIQGKVLTWNPRYRNSWKIPGRNVSGTGMGIKKNGQNGSRSSCSCWELPDDSGRRGPSDKPPSDGFGIPDFKRKPARRSFRANTARQYRRRGCSSRRYNPPHRVCRFWEYGADDVAPHGRSRLRTGRQSWWRVSHTRLLRHVASFHQRFSMLI